MSSYQLYDARGIRGSGAEARFVPREEFNSELGLLLNVFLYPRGQADLLSVPLGLALEMLSCSFKGRLQKFPCSLGRKQINFSAEFWGGF